MNEHADNATIRRTLPGQLFYLSCFRRDVMETAFSNRSPRTQNAHRVRIQGAHGVNANVAQMASNSLAARCM